MILGQYELLEVVAFDLYVARSFPCGGTRKSAFFSTEFGNNCVHFGGFRKAGILSNTEMLYFEERNTANAVDTRIG